MTHIEDEITHPRTHGYIRRWALWSSPAHVTALILLVEVGALVSLVIAIWSNQPHLSNVLRFAVLCILSGTFAEAVDRSERIRGYLVGSGPFTDAATVWTVAAIICLPADWAGLTTLVVYTHWLLRSRRGGFRAPHRIIYTGATVVLAVICSSVVLTASYDALGTVPAGPRYLIAVICAMATCRIINYTLVWAVIYLATRPRTERLRLLNRDEQAFEYVTVILGVFTGEILLHTPWLTPGALAILALLYRGAMVTKLQAESSTDQKTGLLNFTSWRETTMHALVRTARLRQPVALMLIDLDHFKRINDTHGHLVGDQVLTAVADCLRADLREYDAVGRFGGEEFVVFLDNADLYAAVAAANRLRTSISDLLIDGSARVTASIGIAHSSKSAASLEALLERADAALYEAKSAGRDQVRAVAASSEVGQPAA